jgi:hypothetical protein
MFGLSIVDYFYNNFVRSEERIVAGSSVYNGHGSNKE